jgi:hypothetical protein
LLIRKTVNTNVSSFKIYSVVLESSLSWHFYRTFIERRGHKKQESRWFN